MGLARVKTLVRVLLVVLVAAASAGVAWLGFGEMLSWARVGALLALGLGCLRALPGGSRAAGWLFAVWLGLSLILLGTADDVIARVPLERTRLAIAGGGLFLALASLALWSCTRTGEEPSAR